MGSRIKEYEGVRRSEIESELGGWKRMFCGTVGPCQRSAGVHVEHDFRIVRKKRSEIASVFGTQGQRGHTVIGAKCFQKGDIQAVSTGVCFSLTERPWNDIFALRGHKPGAIGPQALPLGTPLRAGFVESGASWWRKLPVIHEGIG